MVAFILDRIDGISKGLTGFFHAEARIRRGAEGEEGEEGEVQREAGFWDTPGTGVVLWGLRGRLGRVGGG
jgi:hypothetical protein